MRDRPPPLLWRRRGGGCTATKGQSDEVVSDAAASDVAASDVSASEVAANDVHITRGGERRRGVLCTDCVFSSVWCDVLFEPVRGE